MSSNLEASPSALELDLTRGHRRWPVRYLYKRVSPPWWQQRMRERRVVCAAVALGWWSRGAHKGGLPGGRRMSHLLLQLLPTFFLLLPMLLRLLSMLLLTRQLLLLLPLLLLLLLPLLLLLLLPLLLLLLTLPQLLLSLPQPLLLLMLQCRPAMAELSREDLEKI